MSPPRTVRPYPHVSVGVTARGNLRAFSDFRLPRGQAWPPRRLCRSSEFATSAGRAARPFLRGRPKRSQKGAYHPATFARVDAPSAFPFTHGVKGPHSRRAVSFLHVLAAAAVAMLTYMRACPRSASLPLQTAVDGPAPATAARVLVFLHGRGGSIAQTAKLVQRLRDAGLPADVSVVLVEGPFPTPFGHAWGSDAAEQATSRARVRARLAELLGAHRARLVIAGFSQGAGVAGDLAVEEARVDALASFSPCGFWLRDQLPKRAGLRVLLAHGNRDAVCPVNESRSLAQVLKNARARVQYLEFDGEHTVPAEVVRALVALVTDAP